MLTHWRRRRACLHHDPTTGTTWTTRRWIYATFSRERLGRVRRCITCGRRWKDKT